MTKFQGSGFSIDLPAGSIDVSSYCFAFPKGGQFTPTLSVGFVHPEKRPDMKSYTAEQLKTLYGGTQDFKLISQTANTRGNWDYVVSVVEWGPDDNRTRQKQLHIFVSGDKDTIFTLIATDQAQHYASTESLFDDVIKTFDPNGIQML